MLAFLIRRIGQGVVVMIAVGLISFAMFSYTGDPVHQMLGKTTSIEEKAALRESLGLNDPMLIQFGRFVSDMAQLKFGFSYQHRRPVIELLVERLPATLDLAILSSIVTIIVGVVFGVYTGINRRGAISRVILIATLVGVSAPAFVVGILLVFQFSVIMNLFPAFGRGELVNIGFWATGLFTYEGLKAMILPTITISVFQISFLIRLVRTEILEILKTDYIEFAKARGLPRKRIYFKHALKNAMIPVITAIALMVGGTVTGSIVAEQVFQWPGLGLLLIQAINSVDIPIISTYLTLIALFFVILNFLVDLAYGIIDPRVRIHTSKGDS